MKFKTNELFENIQGKLGPGLFLYNYKYLLQVNGQQMNGVIHRRSKSSFKPNFQRNNLNNMFRIMAIYWKRSNSEEKQSWNIRADQLLKNDYVVKSGFQLYVAFFMSLYCQVHGLYPMPKDISFPSVDNSKSYPLIDHFKVLTVDI